MKNTALGHNKHVSPKLLYSKLEKKMEICSNLCSFYKFESIPITTIFKSFLQLVFVLN